MSRRARLRALSAGVLVPVTALLLAACTAAPPASTPSAPVASAPPVASSAAPSSAASETAGGDSPLSASRSTPTPSSSFDLTRRSRSDPASIWVVVDKRRPLKPKSWVPKDLVQPAVPHTNTPLLREPAAKALERMVAAARKDGVRVVSLSAYRPYTVQKTIYDRNVRAMGKAAAEKLTARPGYSEHQTGLADDLGDGSGRCPITACFAGTAAGRWLASNAWRYGWIMRYPKGQHAQTGIEWEPWHFRYVGTGLSRHMHATGQTVLERVFDLPASPDYR